MADFDLTESQGGSLPSGNEVSVMPLNSVIGPTEVELTTGAEALLADFTDVAMAAQGVVQIQNKGSNSIYIALHTSSSSGPSVTTANGLEIGAGGVETLDYVGGLAVWGIAETGNQSTGSGTRIIGGKRA